MKFYDYTFGLPKNEAKRHITLVNLICDARDATDKLNSPEPYMSLMACTSWELSGSPYYNVWPKILPMLLSIKLDRVKCNQLVSPLTQLLIRLPVIDNRSPITIPMDGSLFSIKTILIASTTPSIRQFNVAMGEEVLAGDASGTVVRAHLEDVTSGKIQTLSLTLPTSSEETVETWLQTITHMEVTTKASEHANKESIDGYLDGLSTILRLVSTLCLLDKNLDVITPDVLTDDRDKYDLTHDQKFVDKAIRRGKFGWDIGRYLETQPHWRNPCYALYWTGVGRTVPKIIFRKGSFIHKDKIGGMPTGYADKEPCPV